jgi:hypothetical protein
VPDVAIGVSTSIFNRWRKAVPEYAPGKEAKIHVDIKDIPKLRGNKC